MPHELPNDLRLRILENNEILENPKITWRHSLVPSLPCRNKSLALVLKKYAKADIKVFRSCLTSLCFLNFSQNIFCTGL